MVEGDYTEQTALTSPARSSTGRSCRPRCSPPTTSQPSAFSRLSTTGAESAGGRFGRRLRRHLAGRAGPYRSHDGPSGSAGIGATAVSLLLERLDGDRTSARHVVLKPELTIRSTTGPAQRRGTGTPVPTSESTVPSAESQVPGRQIGRATVTSPVRPDSVEVTNVVWNGQRPIGRPDCHGPLHADGQHDSTVLSPTTCRANLAPDWYLHPALGVGLDSTDSSPASSPIDLGAGSWRTRNASISEMCRAQADSSMPSDLAKTKPTIAPVLSSKGAPESPGHTWASISMAWRKTWPWS